MTVTAEQIKAGAERFGQAREALGMSPMIDDEVTLRMLRAVMESDVDKDLRNELPEGA